jgi:transcription antitermination factor NusG
MYGQVSEQPESMTSFPAGTVSAAQWFAVQVRARHEKKISSTLQLKGFEAYLPLVSRTHQWSDRKIKVELPLFPCYVFVKVASVGNVCSALYESNGFLGIVGDQGKGTAIPEQQIEEVRQLLQSKLPFRQTPFLKIGQRVRVCGGPLEGVKGILTGQNSERWLVVSVDAIHGSLAVRVEGYNVEAV